MPSSRARPEVVAELVSEYSTLAGVTAFTEHDLEKVFDEEEMKTINDLLLEMKAAQSENEKTAKLIANIDKYAGVVLKFMRNMGGMPI